MKPQSIDRYQIKTELGRGGMATVYQAFDPLFERTVAIKVLPAEFSRDPNFRARFIREARTIAALEHPAIVPVYDYGEDYNQPFLVMRYMPGGSLADKLHQGTLTLEETAAILQRIGSALDAAHKKNLIHRDLKPANILFDQYGDAYLADFGIVHVTASSEALTATGSLVGTPSYMSPEQVHGDVELDGRSDIYALGVILFQMLSGDVPYSADTPAKAMMRHVLDPVPHILDTRPDLSAQFDTLISKAMAKDRDNRYATAEELSAALNEIMAEGTRSAPGVVPDTAVPADLPQPTTPPQAEFPPQPESVNSAVARPQPEAQAAPRRPLTPALDQVAGFKPAPAPKIQPRPEKGGRRLTPAFWVGIGLLVLICLGMVGGGLWVANNLLSNSGSNIVTNDLPAETTVAAATISSSNEANPAGTATAVALIETREQLAIAAKTPVSASPAADDARESALATRESLAATAAAENPGSDQPGGNLRPIFGPVQGALIHDDDNLIESYFADINPADFILQAEINNPYAPTTGGWDWGLTFRQVNSDNELRLVIHSDGFWNLNDRRGDEDNFIQEGELSKFLNLQETGSNELLVAALGDQGYFFLNGRFISTLDLASRTEAGDLALGTGFYVDSEHVGAETQFTNFTVWSGSPLLGPENGGLDHIDDDFIKTYEGEIELYNFIATADFGSPYPTSIGPWDIGYAFRDEQTGEQFWFIIESSGEWSFIDRQADEDVFLDDGLVSNLNTAESASNRLVLLALNDQGYVFLNEAYITELNLASRQNPGDVSVVTAFFTGDEIEGYTTTFDDFTVWPLP